MKWEKGKQPQMESTCVALRKNKQHLTKHFGFQLLLKPKTKII